MDYLCYVVRSIPFLRITFMFVRVSLERFQHKNVYVRTRFLVQLSRALFVETQAADLL